MIWLCKKGDITVKIGFDNEKYLALQAEHIRQRMSQFGGKLYLEFGGKLFDDYHASRVLPGFQPDSKIRMLETIRDDVEIVIAICAGDIEKTRPVVIWASATIRTCCGSSTCSGGWGSMWAPWSSPSTPASLRRMPSSTG